MKIIVCTDINGGIGKEGNLLKVVKSDMKRFREATMGSIVLMGVNTARSLPGKKPLPGRYNWVYSREGKKVDDLEPGFMYLNEEEVLEAFLKPDLWVIGGGKIYEMALPYTKEIWLSMIPEVFDADTFFRVPHGFFPDLPIQNCGDHTFTIYRRKQ